MTRLKIDGVQLCASDVKVLKADEYVCVLRIYTLLLLRLFWMNFPVYRAKRYSATLKVSEASVAPTLPMTDDGHKLICSRLGNRLRIADTAKFNRYNTKLKDTICNALMQPTPKFFSELRLDGQPRILVLVMLFDALKRPLFQPLGDIQIIYEYQRTAPQAEPWLDVLRKLCRTLSAAIHQKLVCAVFNSLFSRRWYGQCDLWGGLLCCYPHAELA